MSEEQGQHNAASRLVWRYWLKTGLPMPRKTLEVEFDKLGEDDSLKAHFIQGRLPDCEKIRINVKLGDGFFTKADGYVPSREWIHRQLHQVLFHVNMEGSGDFYFNT